jgi:hypothetical protein
MSHVPSTEEGAGLQLIENQWHGELLAQSCVAVVRFFLYKNLNNVENTAVNVLEDTTKIKCRLVQTASLFQVT